MKKIKILSMLIILASCSKNNDSRQNTLNSQLIGSWKVLSIEEINEAQQTNAPSSEDPIVFNFAINSDLFGSTNNNRFSGKYSLTDEDIIISEFAYTLVSRTEWGELFFSAISERESNISKNITLKYTVSGDSLIIENNNEWRMFLELD